MKPKSLIVLALTALVGAVCASRCPGQWDCANGMCRPLANIGAAMGQRPPVASATPRYPVPESLFEKHSGIVRVLTKVDSRTTDAATGVVINYDGACVIVTNEHAVRDSAGAIMVRTVTGQTVAAKLIGYNRDWDVAVLYAPDLPRDTLCMRYREDRVQEGERVTLYGYGRGLVGRLVRFVAAVVRFATFRTGEAMDFFVVGAANEDGDSGGPIFDQTGSVVGIQWGGDPSGNITIGVTMPRVLRVLRELGVSRNCEWYRGVSGPPVYARQVVMAPPPGNPGESPEVMDADLTVDMTGIESALGKQAEAAAMQAESVSKLSASVAAYVDIQTKILIGQEQAKQAEALQQTAGNVISAGVAGYQDGGVRGAVASVVGSNEVGWTIGEYIAAAIIGMTGVGGIVAVGARAVIPWVTKLGLKQVAKMLNAPNQTDADEVLDIAKVRLNGGSPTA